MIFLLLLLLLLPGVAWADTFYLSDTNIVLATLETLATSAPSSVDRAQGWTVATKATGNFAAYRPDTTITRTSGDWGSEPSAFTQRGYRTNATVLGRYAAGNWVLAYKVRSNTYYAQKGYVKYRLWRSTNANGSSATQITPGWQSSALIGFTGANQDQTGTITWAAGSAVVLTNEYLFLEIEWACNTSGGNNSAVVYWTHNEGAAEKLDTPTFAPVHLSGAATMGNVTASGTMAEVINISGQATMGNVTADIDMERLAGISLSGEATMGAVTASGTMAEVVTLGSSGPLFDMGAYERKSAINTSLASLTANIAEFFPNETVRFDLQGTLTAATSAATINEGATMSVRYVPTVTPVRDMGAWETFALSPYNASAEITMTTDFSLVSLSLSANLTKITASVAAGEGAGMSVVGTAPKTAADILMAEIVSADIAANTPKLMAQMDMIGDPGLPFINPIPGMSLGLTPTGGNIPHYWRK